MASCNSFNDFTIRDVCLNLVLVRSIVHEAQDIKSLHIDRDGDGDRDGDRDGDGER